MLNTVITTTTEEITTTTKEITTTTQPKTTTTSEQTTTLLTTTPTEMTTTLQPTTTSEEQTTTSSAHHSTTPTTTMQETTTFLATTTTEEPTTTSKELPIHCCCRCCYDVASPLTSSCTVCGRESLVDASLCASHPPPSPTTFTRSTEPNFEPPAQLEGSKFTERLAFAEEFLVKEQWTEMLASMPLSKKVELGVSASEFILDCIYDGVPCNYDT